MDGNIVRTFTSESQITSVMFAFDLLLYVPYGIYGDVYFLYICHFISESSLNVDSFILILIY